MANPYSETYGKVADAQCREKETHQTHEHDVRGSKRKLPQRATGVSAHHDGSISKHFAKDTNNQGYKKTIGQLLRKRVARISLQWRMAKMGMPKMDCQWMDK